MQQESNQVIPAKAPVAPRAFRTGSTVALRLDQLVTPYIEQHSRGVIYITAPACGGKTTAINHLRATFPADANIAYFDDPQFDHWMSVAGEKLVVLTTSSEGLAVSRLASFELTGWTEDDCFEYLASMHRAQCASVMKRLKDDPLVSLLEASPMHLRSVMDDLAGDESLINVGDSLRRAVQRMIGDAKRYDRVLDIAEPALRDPSYVRLQTFLDHGFSRLIAQFCIQPAVLLSLCCDTNARLLARGLPAPCLGIKLSRTGIREIARAARSSVAAIETLDRLIVRSPGLPVGMAASIRLAIDPLWRPAQAKCIDLSGAILNHAQWSNLNLRHSILQHAELRSADLRAAQLGEVIASRANCSGADLQGASLLGARFSGATFDVADLSKVDASGAFLNGATFRYANLSGAILHQAALGGACLDDANLSMAQLVGAHLYRVTVENARFDGADLTGARLKHVNMTTASWMGVRFDNALLQACWLDGLELPSASFNHADFKESTLTATRIPGGKFHKASFHQAGLADIDWPDADLRDADFTNASFHMGSSRSGLVDSIIPCEGSKTGFYTDDYFEQDFKSPEEIRKANLCGADLRGANVFKTDWYLVDLRGAHYTPDQGSHFERCRAILHSRTPD